MDGSWANESYRSNGLLAQLWPWELAFAMLSRRFWRVSHLLAMCEAKIIRPVNKYLSNTSVVLRLDFQKVEESQMRHRVQQPIVPASENGWLDRFWVGLTLLTCSGGPLDCFCIVDCHQGRLCRVPLEGVSNGLPLPFRHENISFGRHLNDLDSAL